MNSYNSHNNYYTRNRGQQHCHTAMPVQKPDCDCNDSVIMPRTNSDMMGMPIAMAYVPWQTCDDLYEPCKALYEGTAFVALNKPFCGVRG